MDLFGDLGLFFFGLLLVGWGIPLLFYLRHRKQKHAWQTFAQRHSLHFEPANFFGREPYVTGLYKGYQLGLGIINAFQLRGIISYTHLGLSSASPVEPDHLLQDPELSGQPLTVDEVAQLLRGKDLPVGLKGVIKAEAFGQKIYYEQFGLELEADFLTFVANLLHDLAKAYPAIAALGGEVIPSLQSIASSKKGPFQPIATQLLQDIAEDTTARLGNQAQHCLCLACLTRYKAHEITLTAWKSATYYGCRTCGKSRDLFRGKVVAVLDASAEAIWQKDSLYINWLRRRDLFDFDEVQIIQATDEAVERFAVQVGNDTDPLRQAHYEHMTCTVQRNCRLSENTIRILEHTFGQVTIKEDAPATSRTRLKELPHDDIGVRYSKQSNHEDRGSLDDVRT
jgi:hypothetical protein